MSDEQFWKTTMRKLLRVWNMHVEFNNDSSDDKKSNKSTEPNKGTARKKSHKPQKIDELGWF
jgi:hypothetical protein